MIFKGAGDTPAPLIKIASFSRAAVITLLQTFLSNVPLTPFNETLFERRKGIFK